MLNVKAFGVAAGVLWGSIVLLMTLLIVIQNDGGDHLKLLDKIYIGYQISFAGGFVGFVYGFAHAFIIGALFAWIYNTVTGSPSTRGAGAR
jgi:hypothetical protein